MMNISQIRRKILPVLRKHKVKKAGIFGSAARGEMKKKSDVDILVEIPDKHVSLLDFIGIQDELKSALGRKVDLVEYCTIHPLAKKRILGEEVRIL
jgi:predicted nucleotidyltransferase